MMIAFTLVLVFFVFLVTLVFAVILMVFYNNPLLLDYHNLGWGWSRTGANLYPGVGGGDVYTD